MKYLLFISILFTGAGCVDSGLGTQTSIVEMPYERTFTPPEGSADGPGELGPWTNRLMVAISEDAVNWTKTGMVISDQADVPDLAFVDGVLYLYYTGWTIPGMRNNQTVVAVSKDAGATWIYSTLDLSGFEKMVSPVDPDIQYVDGVFRLFLTSDPNDGDGPRTYYAESDDGIHFEKKGIAFAKPGKQVLDPNTILIGDTWHFFAGGGSGNWHGTSQNGTEFIFVGSEPFIVDGRIHMMSNGIRVGDEYRYWAFSNQGTDIVSFTTQDGEDWEYHGVAIAFEGPEAGEAHSLKDATVIQLEDGTYMMVYVTGIPE